MSFSDAGSADPDRRENSHRSGHKNSPSSPRVLGRGLFSMAFDNDKGRRFWGQGFVHMNACLHRGKSRANERENPQSSFMQRT